jgi:twitching motility protein PilT
MDLNMMLKETLDLKASDLHLTVGLPPTARVNGRFIQLKYKSLTPQDTWALARPVLSEALNTLFKEKGEVDISYSVQGLGRFRVNIFKQRGSISLAIRLISPEILTFSQLGLPDILDTFSRKLRGLILVTGPTGSGKSTTLASIIDLINSERACHIVTLEDPIEYLHKHKKSIVNQREIGVDSASYASALRASLRQDPDVILVGEMRDLETISIAVTAAETGHLVLSTLHTNNAPSTIDRIIDVFPSNQQKQIRIQLAESLIGVISQQLLPNNSYLKRIPAVEVLVCTSAVKNLIREGKTHQIDSVIQTGRKYSMQSMDSAIVELYKKGQISKETAQNYCSDLETLIKLM